MSCIASVNNGTSGAARGERKLISHHSFLVELVSFFLFLRFSFPFLFSFANADMQSSLFCCILSRLILFFIRLLQIFLTLFLF